MICCTYDTLGFLSFQDSDFAFFPPSFRLEDQTKKLQKDMKKSTDADLGK